MGYQRLHIQPIGGVAGDMLLAALCDLGASQLALDSAFASLGISGLRFAIREVRLNGERALYVRSLRPRRDPACRHLDEVLEILERAEVAAPARALATRIFTRLAAAEAKVHGGGADHVHLHEVGQLDSILDVLGVAVAYVELGAPKVTCMPLPIGHGTVVTMHGQLTCPVPAVRALARQAHVPLVKVPLVGETVTPTGIAVVAELTSRYVHTPRGAPSQVGVGAGTRRFADRANVVRIQGFEGRVGA